MPLVVGVLAIIFAVIGIALTFLLAFGFGEELRLYGVTKEDLGGFGTLMNLAVIPSTVIFALHLAGGIFCVRFHRWAPNVITAYAVLALVVAGADIVLSALLFPGGMGSTMFDDFAGARIGLRIVSAPWPIVALVLMNLPAARRACGR